MVWMKMLRMELKEKRKKTLPSVFRRRALRNNKNDRPKDAGVAEKQSRDNFIQIKIYL
jgi:hypothetical protein